MPDIYHIPALFQETIDSLDIKPNGVYVDVTFGGGGHSRGIIGKLGREGRLICLDQDSDAFVNRFEDDRVEFIHGNFRFIKNYLKYIGINSIDGILADLGVSFHHFDSTQRGFSFRSEAALDMRMNQKAEKTARELLNEMTEDDLKLIFRNYGEISFSTQLARSIVEKRKTSQIITSSDLSSLVAQFTNQKNEKKELTKVYQALRIAVNDELSNLRSFLIQAVELLKPGGRIAVLSYHSLEDRMVKHFFKTGNFEGEIKRDIYGKLLVDHKLKDLKPVVPTDSEVFRNPRSRSAKLRVAIKQ